MGGIVSSQCGIPLKLTTLFKGNDIGSNTKYFLPKATCLSDVLNTLGYHNVFLNGATLQFAGINNFLKTHHYHEMLGKEEWLKQGFHDDQMTPWGLPDDLLFEAAKLKLNTLMKSQQLFNLTLLTVDTHGINGFLNQTCAKQGGKSFEDIIECSANQVADFINYVDQKGWLDQVTIVVMGDHLAMKNAAYHQLATQSPRYIFNLIVSHQKPQQNREQLLHVDVFPTILSALDVTWPSGEKLALGYSALTPLSQPLDELDHFEAIKKINNLKSPKYNQMWSARSIAN